MPSSNAMGNLFHLSEWRHESVFFLNLINECVNSAYILHKLHFRYDTGQHLKSKQLKDAAEIQTL